MAGSADIGLSTKRRGLRMAVRAAERAVVQGRPILGNSPDDRKDYPDFESSQESLRRCPPARPTTRTVARRQCAPPLEPRARTLRFPGMTESIGPMESENQNHPNLGERCRLPLVGPPAPGKERDGRNAPCSSSAMSSGRLFLDRVARQQSPSPLHRHPQTNTHFPKAQVILLGHKKNILV